MISNCQIILMKCLSKLFSSPTSPYFLGYPTPGPVFYHIDRPNMMMIVIAIFLTVQDGAKEPHEELYTTESEFWCIL